MIEADAVDVLTLDKIKDIVQLLNIVVIDGKPQSYTLSHSHAVLNACHGLLEGPLHAPELVINILQAVQGNPHITYANLLDTGSHLTGNQGAVGGQGRAHPLLLGILRQLKEIRANQRLAAGKQQHRHMKIRQVINKSLGLRRGQLILVFLAVRAHVAMTAFQVAGLGGIPHHHRPHALTGPIPHGVGRFCIAQGITIILPGK